MAADTQNYGFPPQIAGAVIKVMKGLGTLDKGRERNDAGAHYQYASIDDFIQHVRGECAEAGLFIIPNEARDAETQEVTTRAGKSMVVWNARFAFTLAHESGESYGPIFKGVMVPANGAQAAGSAQSYALKQFMRGLFLIPTGDRDDPDAGGIEIASKGEAQSPLQKKADAIRKKIRDAKDLSALGLVWNDNGIDLEEMRASHPIAYEYLEREYQNRKKELEDA